jgi:hypothetical protein
MKRRNVFMIYVLSAAIIFSGCKSMSKTASGALIEVELVLPLVPE